MVQLAPSTSESHQVNEHIHTHVLPSRDNGTHTKQRPHTRAPPRIIYAHAEARRGGMQPNVAHDDPFSSPTISPREPMGAPQPPRAARSGLAPRCARARYLGARCACLNSRRGRGRGHATLRHATNVQFPCTVLELHTCGGRISSGAAQAAREWRRLARNLSSCASRVGSALGIGADKGLHGCQARPTPDAGCVLMRRVNVPGWLLPMGVFDMVSGTCMDEDGW